MFSFFNILLGGIISIMIHNSAKSLMDVGGSDLIVSTSNKPAETWSKTTLSQTMTNSGLEECENVHKTANLQSLGGMVFRANSMT